MSDTSDDTDVGYGKPPTQSRFKKGQSGNPGGRPKGTLNFASDLDDVLHTTLPMTRNGRQEKISGQKAALLRLREKALNGDARALDRYIGLAERRSAELGSMSAERVLTASEADILERFEEELLERAKADIQREVGGQDDGDA